VIDGLLMNLAAIENSDHMTSPQADKYDFDGWYRATITELIKVVREQHALDIRAAVEDQMIELRRNYDDEEELWGIADSEIYTSLGADS
jgi:hypothetical protein